MKSSTIVAVTATVLVLLMILIGDLNAERQIKQAIENKELATLCEYGFRGEISVTYNDGETHRMSC